MFDAYGAGREDTLTSLGLLKVAAYNSLWRRAGRWASRKLPTARGVGQAMVGSPRQFAGEIAKGRVFSKGSLVRQGMKAPDPLSKLMFYGVPAVETAGIAIDDSGNKAQRIGASLGGSAMGLAAYRPLGLLGSMAADPIGRSIGGAMGQTAGYLGDKVIGKDPQQNLSLGNR